MVVKKYFLIRRIGSDRYEIIERSKLYAAGVEDDRDKYVPIISTYNDEDEYFIFNQNNDPVSVTIHGNDDLPEKLRKQSKAVKRIRLAAKKYEESPKKIIQRKNDDIHKTDEQKITHHKKELSAAKEQVIQSADNLYAFKDKEELNSPSPSFHHEPEGDNVNIQDDKISKISKTSATCSRMSVTVEQLHVPKKNSIVTTNDNEARKDGVPHRDKKKKKNKDDSRRIVTHRLNEPSASLNSGSDENNSNMVTKKKSKVSQTSSISSKPLKKPVIVAQSHVNIDYAPKTGIEKNDRTTKVLQRTEKTQMDEVYLGPVNTRDLYTPSPPLYYGSEKENESIVDDNMSVSSKISSICSTHLKKSEPVRKSDVVKENSKAIGNVKDAESDGVLQDTEQPGKDEVYSESVDTRKLNSPSPLFDYESEDGDENIMNDQMSDRSKKSGICSTLLKNSLTVEGLGVVSENSKAIGNVNDANIDKAQHDTEQPGKKKILDKFFVDESSLEKAEATTNIQSRIKQVMNGFWSDEVASKLCLKSRANQSDLTEVDAGDLASIKAIVEVLNEQYPIKNLKKKNFKIEQEIRSCASQNFKERRQKLKGKNKKEGSVDAVDSSLLETEIETEIAGLSSNSFNILKRKMMELEKKEKELKKKEEYLNEREQKLKNKINNLKKKKMENNEYEE